MNKYAIVGWGFLIVGIIIFGLFLALLLFSCFYVPTLPRSSAAPGEARCWFITVVYPEIIIGIVMIITGIVLRSRDRKKEMNS